MKESDFRWSRSLHLLANGGEKREKEIPVFRVIRRVSYAINVSRNLLPSDKSDEEKRKHAENPSYRKIRARLDRRDATRCARHGGGFFAKVSEGGPGRRSRRVRAPNFSAQKRSRIHSTGDDAKLARLAAQFRGRDDAKKKEDGERKERSET